MSIEALREIVARLNTSALALAALGAALDASSAETALEPDLKGPIEKVLSALSAEKMVPGANLAELKPMLAEIRITMLQGTKLLFPQTRVSGWSHTDAEILQAAGDVSAAFPHVLRNRIAPSLHGLSQRLESPDACFLDVGVGVAAMAIEMARLWPSLQIVGIDPWAPSLDIARRNVRTAGFLTRIELRPQAVEDIPDTNAFDLAWIPGAFIPEQAITAAVGRVRRALVPGGWMLFAVVNPGTDPLVSSAARLRTALSGGSLMAPAQIEALLTQTGLADVHTLPSPPNALVTMIVGRRP